MAYTTIVFNASDAWGTDICSFKVNLIAEELSITYRNNNGGYTTNGIKLASKELKHIKQATSQKIFEKFRDGKWKEEMDAVWMVDGIEWEAQFVSDDGLPMLEFKNEMQSYLPPPILRELVNYVLRIGAPKSIDLEIFK